MKQETSRVRSEILDISADELRQMINNYCEKGCPILLHGSQLTDLELKNVSSVNMQVIGMVKNNKRTKTPVRLELVDQQVEITYFF